jgi:translation initiation factor IF-3
LDKKVFFATNDRISAKQVRLIDADGTQIGVRPIEEARALARTRGLDLVEIAASAQPPVCKVLDYHKFRYEEEKKVRDARKKQKAGLLKEVRLRPNIGQHDLEVKLKHVKEFLAEKDKVRFTVVFRGRENQHQELGLRMLKEIEKLLEPVAIVEGRVSTQGNRMSMTLIPK